MVSDVLRVPPPHAHHMDISTRGILHTYIGIRPYASRDFPSPFRRLSLPSSLLFRNKGCSPIPEPLFHRRLCLHWQYYSTPWLWLATLEAARRFRRRKRILSYAIPSAGPPKIMATTAINLTSIILFIKFNIL